MKIVSKVNIDLGNPENPRWIRVMQADTNTRCVEISLFQDGAVWDIPAGITAAVAFKKPDGTVGLYDKLSDETQAVAISGNTISAVLVPQMMAVAGVVQAVITMQDADYNQLSTFPFYLQVEENPAGDKIQSENYCYYTNILEINNALNEALERMDLALAELAQKVENGELNGKSAYDYAMEAGYSGTEQSFMEVLANAATIGGVPGYTPVRGVDYWTEEDIAQIKAYVDESILGGAW